MTRLALAVLALAACTPDGTTPDTVHLASARAEYSERRPDGTAWDTGLSPGPEVIAHFTVDGAPRGTCKKRWTAREVVCTLGFDVAATAQLALIVEDEDADRAERMGAATLALAPLAQRTEVTLPLVAEAGVLRGSVAVLPRWQPRVPLAAAQVIMVGAGALLALLLHALLRRRFVVGPRRAAAPSSSVRSPAMISAGLAATVAWIGAVPLLDHAATLEPLALAAPMGLGAYAAAATIIDAIASRSFGRRRGVILTAALAVIAALPVVMAVDALPPQVLMAGLVIFAIGMFVG